MVFGSFHMKTFLYMMAVVILFLFNYQLLSSAELTTRQQALIESGYVKDKLEKNSEDIYYVKDFGTVYDNKHKISYSIIRSDLELEYSRVIVKISCGAATEQGHYYLMNVKIPDNITCDICKSNINTGLIEAFKSSDIILEDDKTIELGVIRDARLFFACFALVLLSVYLFYLVYSTVYFFTHNKVYLGYIENMYSIFKYSTFIIGIASICLFIKFII